MKATFAAEDQRTEAFNLLSGHAIPAVGFGTSRTESQAYDSVFTAIVEVSYIITYTYI